MKCYKQIFTYDSQIGFKYVPNLNATVTGDYLDKIFDYKINTDKFGYRNNNLLENYLDEVEILFIGCSFTSGDGIENQKRFSDLLDFKSYNAGLSGSDLTQQMLILKDCKNFINPKTIIFSPYIGCINRMRLKSRETILHNTRHVWFKPYMEHYKDQIILKNNPVPRPILNLEKIDAKKSNISKVEKIKNFLFRNTPRDNFLRSIRDSYLSEKNFLICKEIYSISKYIFPNAKFFLMPLGNYDYLKFGNDYTKSIVDNFYNELAKNVGFKFLNVNKLISKSKIDLIFYKEDGHLNNYGHKTISEILKKLL